MKPVLVLIPTEEIAKKIFSFRKYCVDNNLSQIDSRLQVLPHLTLVYAKNDVNAFKLKTLIQNLEKITFSSIALPIVDIQSWDNKISLMFDQTSIIEQIVNLETQFSEVNILYEKVNFDLRDMKIIRQILPDQIEFVKKLIESDFPKIIVFDKRILLNEEGEEILDAARMTK